MSRSGNSAVPKTSKFVLYSACVLLDLISNYQLTCTDARSDQSSSAFSSTSRFPEQAQTQVNQYNVNGNIGTLNSANDAEEQARPQADQYNVKKNIDTPNSANTAGEQARPQADQPNVDESIGILNSANNAEEQAAIVAGQQRSFSVLQAFEEAWKSAGGTNSV